MAQVQYQEQEELSLDDFDKPKAYSPFRRAPRKKEFEDEALWAALEAQRDEEYLNVRDQAIEGLPTSKDESINEIWLEPIDEDEDSEYLEFSDRYDEYPWKGLTEVLLAYSSRVMEWLIKVDLDESAGKLIDGTELFITDLPLREKELKLIMSFCMIFYGGSWPRLAYYMAAYEIFGTEKVIDELSLVSKCLYNSFSNQEATRENHVFTADNVKEIYARVRQTIKDAGLQISVLLAVFFVAPFAEVCLSIAFASKLSGIVWLQELFSMAFRTSMCDDESSVSRTEAVWIRLLSHLCCNILSLVLLGVGYPSMIIAMYMAHRGLDMVLCDDMNKTFYIFGVPFEFAREDWVDKTTQNYIWGTVAVMSLWQALNGYSGLLEPLSSLVLLFPMIKLYNLLNFNALSVDLKKE